MAQIDSFRQSWFNFCQYKPHQGQAGLHAALARFRTAICGRRWGKSISAAKEAESIICQENKRFWVVAPTYDLTDKVFREVWHSFVILNNGYGIKRKSERERIIEFVWGSTIEGKSADSPDSLVGEGLDGLILDEAAKIKKRIWEQYLRPTLSDRQGSALFITTPEGFNWIYDLYLRGQSEEFANWWSVQSPTWDNPYISKEDIEEARRTLTKETFDQEYGAQFTSFAGKVYPFDRSIHVKKLSYKPEWETYCSIDFGYRMPSVGWYQVGIVEGRPEVHLIDEISHKVNIRTEELADMILRRPYNVLKYYGDPAGEGVQAQSGLGDISILRRRGIQVFYRTDKVGRNIPSGIDLVRSWMLNAAGETRFYVSDKCVGHVEDYENYRYPEHKEDQRLKEEPLKDGRHDHGCDETRYFFANHFPTNKSEARAIQL